MKRATITAIALLMFWLSPGWAEDVRDKEIMVVDQACIERKVTSCLLDLFSKMPHSMDVFFGAGCPPGIERYQVVSVNNKNMALCKYTDMSAVVNRPWNELEPRLSECRKKAEGLPSFYGPNCLRPLAQERMINAMNVELKRLSRQLCDASGGSKCNELDKVPEQ